MSYRKIRGILVRTETLWILFFATILLIVGFSAFVRFHRFGVIDELYNADQITAHIRAMTPAQKSAHIWMSGTLDIIFPLVYGGFFIGMALRFFGRWGPQLALPGIAVIPADITENVVQIMLLSGHENVVWLKTVVTPLKLGLFFLGLTIAVVGLWVGLVRRLLEK